MPETWVLLGLGLVLLVYSLITRRKRTTLSAWINRLLPFYGPLFAIFILVEQIPFENAMVAGFFRSQTKLNLIGKAVLLYSGDYDDRLPQASVWADVVEPYVAQMSQESAETTYLYSLKPKEYLCAFNPNLGGVSTSALTEGSLILCEYHCRSRNSLIEDLSQLPTNRNDGKIAAYIYQKGAIPCSAARIASALSSSASELSIRK